MNLFGHPSSARSTRHQWEDIYSTQSDQLRRPFVPALARMQSSRSHTSLHDLPAGFDNLSLNTRTASSTPAPRHKPESAHSRSSMLTPPVDANLQDPFLSRRVSNVDNNMYLESKAEDDVFGGAKLPVDGKTREFASGQETVEYSSPNTKITPRSDRLSDPITPQNAQGVLPPEACVFVANLSVHRNDEQLEESVHNAFDKFGQCIVKVRRDRHKHPFALVQYHTVEDAEAAIEGGRDLVVDDRKIRTEHAEARRSVVLSRVGGGAISKEEAQGLLGHYGPIQEMQPTTHADARLHGIPEGIWVKFAYYLDFKDALKMFNNSSSLFQVMEPPNLEPRTRTAPAPSGSPPVVQGLRTPRSTTDQKSIFVGNLPADITEAELHGIFSRYGEIKGCNVIRKPITGGQGYNIFGFVEFSNVIEADAAAEAEMDIRGQRIRVEPKEYSARRHTRLQPFGQPGSAERPRAVAWGPSSNAYQSPGPLPYGFQPIYVQQPHGPYAPFNHGYNWVATPPSSGQRRRAPTADDYVLQGSPHPQQYIPIGHPAHNSMTQFQGNEVEEHQHQSRRYR